MKFIYFFLMFPIFLWSQVSIEGNIVPAQVSLDLGVSDKVLTLPSITDINTIQNPERAMLVYDEIEDGVMGYLKYNEPSFRWSNLFLTTDALLLKNVNSSQSTYFRSASTPDVTYIYIPTLDTEFTTVSAGRLVILQFETTMNFNSRCFRGRIRIDVEDSSGTVVATAENLFNFGGVTGVNSSYPYNLNLKFIGEANENYTAKFYQDPTGGVCKNDGTFDNINILVNFY